MHVKSKIQSNFTNHKQTLFSKETKCKTIITFVTVLSVTASGSQNYEMNYEYPNHPISQIIL